MNDFVLCNQLKFYRKRMGYTQKQLSDAVGVSINTISSIENGKYNPSLLLAFKICFFFECSIEDIFYLGIYDSKAINRILLDSSNT